LKKFNDYKKDFGNGRIYEAHKKRNTIAFAILALLMIITVVSYQRVHAAPAASGAKNTTHSHGSITAKTFLGDHLLFVSSTVVSGPENVQPHHVPPPPTGCITLWGQASNVKKLGVVADYNVKTNL